MTINLFIIVFVAAMAYWWSMQGLFSSLLHLGMVIVAGTLALAIWEPLTVNLLLGFKPPIAWAIGLLAPFIVLLIGLRTASDRLVKRNMQFPRLWNMVGGGGLGAVSGVLTAGLVVIGLGFLPMGRSLAGYQAYSLQAYGQIAPGERLWVPVDRWTERFFTFLAADAGWTGGAFTSGGAMGEYQPNLAKQSALVRLRPDGLSAVAATPGAVSLGKVYSHAAAGLDLSQKVTDALKGAGLLKGRKLVLVETTWQAVPGVYDTDGNLRVSPAQVRLIAGAERGPGPVAVHGPIGYSRLRNKNTGQRLFRAFESNNSAAYGINQEETLAWVFLIPENQDPRHLMVRNLRFALPEQVIDAPKKVTAALGSVPQEPKDEEGEDQANGGATPSNPQGKALPGAPKGNRIEPTNKLPGGAFDSNQVTSISPQENGITEGAAQGVAQSQGFVSDKLRVDHIANANVRLKLTPDGARSLLGSAMAAAAQAGIVALETSQGNLRKPIAYVVLSESGERRFEVRRPLNPFARAADLPIDQLRSDDTLYLYFDLNTGAKVRAYRYSGQTQTFDPPWPVPPVENE